MTIKGTKYTAKIMKDI